MPAENENKTVAPPVSSSPDQVGLRVSLIPTEETEKRDPRRGFFLFLTTAIIFTVLMGALCTGLWLWTNSNTQAAAKLDAETADLDQQSKDLLGSIKDAESTRLRLKVLASLLPKHRTGLKVLPFLENYTLPSVGYTSLSVNVDGTVNMAVEAASFEAYAAQINEFKSRPEVKKVVVSSPSPSYDDKNRLTKVSFNFSLTLDRTFFESDLANK